MTNSHLFIYGLKFIKVNDDEIKSCSEYVNVEEWIRELNE
jgi:hypothetical protein